MYGVKIESRISADRNMGDELGERQERMGALEALYQKKDDFKICLQKTALISVNPTPHYILLPVFLSLCSTCD